MSNGVHILLPSLSNKKCTGLSLINRVPGAELEQKLHMIRRDQARLKLDFKIKEAKLWDELYKNDRELKTSFVSKYPYTEAMANKELFYLPRDPPEPLSSKSEIPFAEAYKQFITFRAKTMWKMYGPNGSKYFQRPKYSEIYKDVNYYKQCNGQNMEKIRVKYGDKRKEDDKILKVLNETPRGRQAKRRISGYSNDSGLTPLSRKSSRHETDTPVGRASFGYGQLATAKTQRTLRSNTDHELYTKGYGSTYTLHKIPTIAVNPKVV